MQDNMMLYVFGCGAQGSLPSKSEFFSKTPVLAIGSGESEEVIRFCMGFYAMS